jgi:hypothetical protein
MKRDLFQAWSFAERINSSCTPRLAAAATLFSRAARERATKVPLPQRWRKLEEFISIVPSTASPASDGKQDAGCMNGQEGPGWEHTQTSGRAISGERTDMVKIRTCRADSVGGRLASDSRSSWSRKLQYDHFSRGRFRRARKFLRWPPVKDPTQCTSAPEASRAR